MEPEMDNVLSEEELDDFPDGPSVEDAGESTDDVDEEEDECRVCRGPAEEGHPLFAPCKCSGSIGLIHQDCLTSWLEVTRRDGRCELCKTKFGFDPQYAENAPDRLPPHEVVMGLSSRFLARWLPFTVRIFVAASMWLVVAPLLTSCLYHGWMHRPSSILTRWKRELIPSDIVSGAIIAAIVIISFLSLMSFADFLRVHWQEPRRGGGGEEQRQRDGLVNEAAEVDNDEAGIDDRIADDVYCRRADLLLNTQKEESSEGVKSVEDKVSLESNENAATLRAATDEMLVQLEREEQELRHNEFLMVEQGRDNADVAGGPFPDDHGDSDTDSDMLPLRERGGEGDNAENDLMQVNDHDEDEDDRFVEHGFEDPPRNDIRNEIADDPPFDPLDPGLQDDQVDMEINVALDELLGLRGPIGTLIRNLLWLLAFNATYLGMFAFVPKTVGSAVYAGIFNTTACDRLLKSIPYVYSDDQNQTTLITTLSALNMASMEKDTTFRLPDVATVTLGYFSIAAIIVMMRYGWIASLKLRQQFSVEGTRINTNAYADDGRLHGQWRDRRPAVRHDVMENADHHVADIGANTAVGVALDATVAVVKVGILLFLKMFILPLLLGLCLDASTMALFGHTISDRVHFAGQDLFSFVMLHWVAGITFMLLVTVFLLQLREVTHPDVLAHMIRPQEPQPDLLGNLMNETVFTHVKRMILSFAIYAPLLLLYVTLPVQMLILSGFTTHFSFFNLNFWHAVMPQMQIPLELIMFHLSMLALLERYKNSIGNFQHHWMKFMCSQMGLTEYVLPRSIARFELIGSKAVFLPSSADPDVIATKEVDAFWYELAEISEDVDTFVESHVDKARRHRETEGETKVNGDRVLISTMNTIRLPAKRGNSEESGKHLLSTQIGRFRLMCPHYGEDEPPIIEFWREVPGEETPRPPEGWDDLGAGGAFVQGRWAWGKEKRSIAEGGVAQRTPFRDPRTKKRPLGLLLKAGALFILSWLATTITAFGFMSIPLAVGRSFYFIVRIPQSYIHDPLAFVIGGALFFPLLSLTVKHTEFTQGNLAERFRTWLVCFHFPPYKKMLTFVESLALWGVAAPLALGLSYEAAVVKRSTWFSGSEDLITVDSFLLSWLVGSAILNAWAFLAYFRVFSKQFWANIGNGMLEPPLDENGNPVLARNQGDVEQDDSGDVQSGWQGPRGRVARFFSVLRSGFQEWDWEKVDRIILLDEFARPVTKQVASALVGSSLSFHLLLFIAAHLARFEQGGIVLPLVGVVERGLFRLIVFRICMATHVTVQLCSAFHRKLDVWFEAAHAAARDDRYLIGEVLMDYESVQERQ